jgi:hypothetical protein
MAIQCEAIAVPSNPCSAALPFSPVVRGSPPFPFFFPGRDVVCDGADFACCVPETLDFYG